MEIIKRADAKALGLRFYFTGKACPRGHVAERDVAHKSCQGCERVRHKEVTPEQHAARKERQLAYHHRTKSDPVVIEKARARAKQRDPAKQALWCRERYRNDPAYRERRLEKVRERRRRKDVAAQRGEYQRQRLADPVGREMQNAISRNYRARKKRAPGTHTASDIKNLLIRQDYRCTYCDADLHRVKRHIDHIIPLAKGGGNGPDNLQALCKTCNVRKQATDPEEFAARIRCTAS